MEGGLAAAIARWNTGVASAHLCVLKAGDVVLTVKIDDTAWHAGTDNNPTGEKYGRTAFWRTNNINENSIGVELEGYADAHDGGFTAAQIDACVKIASWARVKYKVLHQHTMDQIPGHHLHSELSTNRIDPGATFPIDTILQRSAS